MADDKTNVGSRDRDRVAAERVTRLTISLGSMALPRTRRANSSAVMGIIERRSTVRRSA